MTGYAKRKTLGVQWGVQSGDLPIGAIVTGAVLVGVLVDEMIFFPFLTTCFSQYFWYHPT